MKTEVAEAIAEITRGAEEVLLEKELAEKLRYIILPEKEEVEEST